MNKEDIPRITKIMTATEVGKLLGLTRQTVNKKIAAGYFKSVHLLDERQYVVLRGEVEAILAGKHDKYKVPKAQL